jgi:RNA ligase (TIGR02306 family)
MERKLATIEKIKEIHPIPDADFLERAVIRGWNVVVKKGEFHEGDFCVYCEIDSLMPERPEFEFLAKYKYRIKTIRLKGQISQGIAFPLNIIPEIYFRNGDRSTAEIGADVTDILGIIKYEEPMPACLGGTAKGRFPSHSIKTDEERIQNLKEEYEFFKQHIWIATEKLDGTSATFYIKDEEFGVASRNLDLKENGTNSFWVFARANNLEYKMRLFMGAHNLKALTLQGELIGEGIQGNKYRIKGQTVRFFRIFDPITYKFFSYEEFIMALDEMGLVSVPIIDDEFTLPDKFEDLITYADGRSALYDTAREGVVFVAKDPAEDYQGRLSFKVISNKFILKHDA